MPIPFEGGCHCGSVRYVCSEEPITVVNCHCGDCQKIAGSAFITGVLVPEGSVEINGEMKSYRVEADSGNHITCLLYTSPSPRDRSLSRMPSSA